MFEEHPRRMLQHFVYSSNVWLVLQHVWVIKSEKEYFEQMRAKYAKAGKFCDVVTFTIMTIRFKTIRFTEYSWYTLCIEKVWQIVYNYCTISNDRCTRYRSPARLKIFSHQFLNPRWWNKRARLAAKYRPAPRFAILNLTAEVIAVWSEQLGIRSKL